jgi:hypothetical protein
MKLEGIDDLETAQTYRQAWLGVEEKDVFRCHPAIIIIFNCGPGGL